MQMFFATQPLRVVVACAKNFLSVPQLTFRRVARLQLVFQQEAMATMRFIFSAVAAVAAISSGVVAQISVSAKKLSNKQQASQEAKEHPLIIAHTFSIGLNWDLFDCHSHP